jgi:hypothetical protein
MMIRAFVLAVVLTLPAEAVFFAQAPASAGKQAPQPAPSPQIPAPGQPPRGPAPAQVTPPAPAPPRREGQPINVKVEVTITDQSGGTQALKKTVTVVTGDSMSGIIRSSAAYDPPIGVVPLNVDVEPQLLTDNRIRLRLNLQYNLPSSEGRTSGPVGQPSREGGAVLRTTDIRENLSLILENGKALVAAQSADPVGDRQVTIEVKATILR